MRLTHIVEFNKEIMDDDIVEEVITEKEFVDNYSHVEENVFYTTHNIPGPGINSDEFYAQISRLCHCRVGSTGEVTESNQESTDADRDENAIKRTGKDESPVQTKQVLTENVELLGKELCGVNCPCSPNRNYIDGILNIETILLPMYECNDYCACRSMVDFVEECKDLLKENCWSGCSNRVIQKGPHKHLNIFRHSEILKGYGVRATQNVRKGEFMCEYVGEVIDKSEAKRRYTYYKYKELTDKKREIDTGSSNTNFYIFHLNEIACHVKSLKDIEQCELLKVTKNPTNHAQSDPPQLGKLTCKLIATPIISSKTFLDQIVPQDSDSVNQVSKLSARFEMFVDATKFGNIARYINHSCDPNCTVLPVRVDSIYPRLAIFARRDIAHGEELTYDYAESDDVRKSTESKAAHSHVVNNSKCVDITLERIKNSSDDGTLNKNAKTSEIENMTCVELSSHCRTVETSTDLTQADGNLEHASSTAIENENISNLKPCLCRSDKCRRFLPYLPLQ